MADAPAANPAGLYGLAARTGTLALSSYLMDTQAGFLSIALPRGGRAMALSAVYVTYGDMRRTNETGQDLGSFTASDVAALAMPVMLWCSASQ